MMNPDSSPEGILGKPRPVRRLNRKAKVIFFLVMGLGLFMLLSSILDKNGSGKPQGDPESAKGFIDPKTRGAVPPESMSASEKAANEKPGPAKPDPLPNPVTSANTAQPQNARMKEAEEFQNELQRDRRRAYMARIARFDSALLANMATNPTLDEREPGASQTEAAPSQASGKGGAFADLVSALGNQLNSSNSSSLSSDPGRQGEKQAFSSNQKLNGYLPFKKRPLLSPYEIKTGTVIPGIMISGINSDLPGQIIAQVSEPVYDTATGNYLLIPQGSRLFGTYDSMVAIGQESALISWNRIIFPDGATLELLNMGGQDRSGYSGFRDQVNEHYLRTFGSAILLSLVGAAYQISQPDADANTLSNRDIVVSQVGQQLSQVSAEKIRQSMQIQPTIQIRPGYRFIIIVNRDMILEPWRG